MFFFSDPFDDAFFDSGVDRRGWAEKSEAALRRERRAMSLFEEFLTEARQETCFPHEKEVVPPTIHLTGACYKTFRHNVMERGCTVKRRELSTTEKSHLPHQDQRRGKMYAILIKVPVHPSKLQEAHEKKQAEAERRAALAREKREQERAAAARRLEEKKALAKKTKEEYERFVAELEQQSDSLKPMNDKENDGAANHEDQSPTKRLKRTPPPIVTPTTVPQESLLQESRRQESQEKDRICARLAREKHTKQTQLLNDLRDEFETKSREAVRQASHRYDQIRVAITGQSSSTVSTAKPEAK